jgi:hypothetical protein
VQNHDEGYILVDEDGEDCCLFFCQIVNPISGVTLTAKADVDWITNIRKYNDSFYCFTALPNDTGAIRYGHIDLTYSTAHKKLTFQQAPNGDIITLSPESMTVNYQGRAISFTVNLKEGFDPKKPESQRGIRLRFRQESENQRKQGHLRCVGKQLRTRPGNGHPR